MVSDARLRLRQTYPATKVLFLPSTATTHTDLIAVSSDCLRIWKLGADAAILDRLLDVCPPRLCPEMDVMNATLFKHKFSEPTSFSRYILRVP
jgi:hypothetical protein